jgi:hypothetical protein
MLFSERPAAAQLVAGLIVPAAFGALVGVMLGVSSAAYWGLQGLAVIGGVLGGLEHPDGSEAADRGLLGGLVFGSFLLLAHAITGAEPKADLGQMPGFLIVFAGIGGALLGALGGSIRAALQRRSVNRAASDGTLPARSRTDTP